MSFSVDLPVTIVNLSRENPIADVFIGERFCAHVLPRTRTGPHPDGSIAIIVVTDLRDTTDIRDAKSKSRFVFVDRQGDSVPWSVDVFENLGPVLDAAMGAGLPFPALE
jgi:hypothetical protein